MRSETVHIHLQAPMSEVFAYLAKATNIPAWATEFVRAWSPVEGRDAIRASTTHGEVVMTTRPDADTGVIDILADAGEGLPALFPTRVIPAPDGTSVFTFTVFQAPDQTEEAFERDVASLRRELEGLRRRFAA